MLRAVVFDLDDTLYPERAYVASGFRAVSAWLEERFGLPSETCLRELLDLFERGPRDTVFDRWVGTRRPIPAPSIAEMVRIYREHDPVIHPRPGVGAMLDRLRTSYRLGLVSDGTAFRQRRKLAALGLDRAFDAVVLSDELGSDAWKPSPRPFVEVLRRLDVEGPSAVYVADNPAKDFLGAHRVGMWSLRVREEDGLHAHEEPPTSRHSPGGVIGSLDALPVALGRIDRIGAVSKA
jgi:putative hydrolase of the HAD superfamily